MAGIVDRLRQEAERNALRARNGIKLVAGVGRPSLGQTPKDLVWRSGHAQLWHYRSDKVTLRPPLLLVYSLVSNSYIFDLQPGNSLVEKLQDAGFDVFLLDWSRADHRQSGERLQDYADYYLPEAVLRTAQEAGSDDVNVLGYCMGGVLTLLFASRHPESPVRSLTVMATPVDFSKFELGTELSRGGRLPIEDLFDDDGNVAEGNIRQLFRLLKPTGDARTYANLLENVWNDEYVTAYQAMSGWSEDHVPFPGTAAREIFEMLLRDNGFVEGTVRLGGTPARLGDIKVPMLTILAERDHIVPAAVAEPLPGLVGSEESELLRLNAGHVGLFVGRTAAKTTVPSIIEFLTMRSEPIEEP